MNVIREADVIASVADALQYISYYHTPDSSVPWGRAYDMGTEPRRATRSRQILTNSRHVR